MNNAANDPDDDEPSNQEAAEHLSMYFNQNNNDIMFVCPLCDLHFDHIQFRTHMLIVHPEFVAIWASTFYGSLFREQEYIEFVRTLFHDINDNNVIDDDVDVDNMTYEQLLQLCEQVGTHKEGVKDIQEVIEKTTEDDPLDVKDCKCTICLEACIKEEHNPVKIKKCKHVFCFECISTWLKENKTCPICKQFVS
jgi:hypothetical protein